jgi:hypothetical protein
MNTPEAANPGTGATCAAEVDNPRHHGWHTHGTPWFPLVLFGLLVLASAPLYASPVAANPAAVAIFWLVAGPLGYLATGGFYWAWSRRHAVAMSPLAYVVTGLGLVALLVVTTWVGIMAFRGLGQLIAVAIGLVVLARSERSWPLATFAIAFFGLALLANLYNLENLAYRLGLGSHGPHVNVLVVGAVLLLAGAGFGLADLAGRRRPR